MGRINPQNLQHSLPGLRRILARFRPHLRHERSLIAGSLGAILGSVALRLLEPWPLKFIFDRLFSNVAPHRLPWVGDLSATTVLAVAASSLLLIVGARAALDYATTIGFAKIGNRVLLKVRNQLFEHLQLLGLTFHQGARTGDLTIRVIGDVNMLRDAVVTSVLPLLANTLVVVGMWTVMFAMEWRLALLAGATLPLLWWWTRRAGQRIRDAARIQRQREGAMASTAAESLGAIRLVRALGIERLFSERFSSRSRDGQKQDVKTARLTARLERTVDVLLALATAGVLCYGAILAMQRRITPGDLLVFITYLRRAFNPVQDFAKYTGRLAKATAAGERVLDLLDRPVELADEAEAGEITALRGRVRFENVQFAYDGGPVVLDGIDFEVEPGKCVALVGPSGIGKSTIVSLLLRLYDPSEGRISVDGRDLRTIKRASLRAQIGVVMQDTVLFAASVRDNIGYGDWRRWSAEPEEKRQQRAEAAARLANAHEFVMAFPGGYDAELGERGATLSGGQRQRLAVARAALRESPILILDEPTTGLDEENQRLVLDALWRLASGRTTVLITHDLRTASRADEILYLEDGRIVERGTHEQLLAAGTRYAALYLLQTAARGAESSPDAKEDPHALAG